MEGIKNLLNQVDILVKKNNELLDKTGARFNIFQITGVNHLENKHSAILAEFLNPRGTHGLKDRFLQSFLELFGTDEIKGKFNSNTARVYTEYSMDKGRMDIVIEYSNTQAIIIENKIYAPDQDKQLNRYNAFAEEKYKKGNYQIIYLTLFGSDASEDSGEGVDYQPISYAEDLINWLERCLEIAVRRPMVRGTINQYINHIKSLTNQSIDMELNKEIIGVMKSNVNAAFEIANNFNNLKSKIVEEFFSDVVEKFNKKVNEKLIKGYKNMLYNQSGGVTFNVFNEYIRFEFTSSNFKNLAYGFKRNEQDKIDTNFDQFLIEKDCFEDDTWWYYKIKTGLSFEDNDIKEIANGNSKSLSQFQECLGYLEELIKLKEEFDNQKVSNQ